MGRMSATSRDPEEWARATEAARASRAETAANIAGQLEALIVEGDIMGGRALFVTRVRQLAEAEARGDSLDVVRAAVMEMVAAGGQWLAALDFAERAGGNGNGRAA